MPRITHNEDVWVTESVFKNHPLDTIQGTHRHRLSALWTNCRPLATTTTACPPYPPLITLITGDLIDQLQCRCAGRLAESAVKDWTLNVNRRIPPPTPITVLEVLGLEYYIRPSRSRHPILCLRNSFPHESGIQGRAGLQFPCSAPSSCF